MDRQRITLDKIKATRWYEPKESTFEELIKKAQKKANKERKAARWADKSRMKG